MTNQIILISIASHVKKVFFKSSDLEIHLEQEHKAERFKCKRCEKEFVLKWRLNKHEKIHNKLSWECHTRNPS